MHFTLLHALLPVSHQQGLTQMPTAARGRVLSLYRQILRIGRSWAGPREEQQYIFSEAQEQFRANQHTTMPADLDEQILEGELRIQYARQYQIPYPRLEHKTQYKRSHPAPRGDFGPQPTTGRTAASNRLTAAMQRRKQVGYPLYAEPVLIVSPL